MPPLALPDRTLKDYSTVFLIVGAAVVLLCMAGLVIMQLGDSGRTWRTVIAASRKDRSELKFEVEEIMTDEVATTLFLRGGMMLKRESVDSDGKKEVVFYKRLRKPDSGKWTLYNDVIYRWKDAKIGEDFNLYSSEEDLDSDTNAWEFCNYAEGADEVGAFRDCGRTGKVEHRFFAKSLKNSRNVLTRVTFMVHY
jgi:hypothetical protein